MTFRLANVAGRAALVADEHIYDLATVSDGAFAPDPMAAIRRFRELGDIASGLADHEPSGAVAGADLGPPVPRPTNVFAIGLNYPDHAAESGFEPPAAPVVFTKFPTCISGPRGDVAIHGDAIDYEAEVVAVIGEGGSDIPAERAWDHVAGVTCGQDISDRVLQFAASPPHFDLGKSRDGYGPIGPVLVSPDALEDRDDIALRCTVGGELRQSGTTRDLIFDIPFLVEYLSAILTLQSGDLIFTGTPDGVGMATGKLLGVGDVIETTVEGVGTLRNACVEP